ncbi:MAG: YecA family protein [Burkholderiales bacterium]|nr:YecA family protein [Burkholderiales bacterium]
MPLSLQHLQSGSPMTSTPATPLTNAEISHLETLLASPAFKAQAMGLDEIQGFLCAAISGPQTVKPEQWLPAVLGNPDYESADQAQAVKNLLMRFHAEIVADLQAAESLGLVLNLTDPSNAADEGEYDYSAWCQAYLDGVESSTVAWTDAGDENEINELLFPISLLAGEIDPKALKQIKPREMSDLLKECREDLPMLAIDIFQYFQSLRTRGNERPNVTAKKPGSDAAQAKPGKKKLH